MPGFHMIATIAVIAAIADKKKVQRSYGNHFPAIAATTITEIGLFLSQRSLWLRSLRSLESSFLMVAAIAELFFFSAIAAIIWKPLSSDRSDNDR